MKKSILLATAATLMISGAAMAYETPSNAANKASDALKSMPAKAEAAAKEMKTTTTEATTSNTKTQPQSAQTVLQLAEGNKEFSTLATAIKAAGLEKTLSSNGPLTVFAPTNAAFEKLGKEKLDNLLKPENKEKLTQILTYHVVPQNLPAASASAQPTSLPTAEGQSLMLKQQGSNLMVQDAKSIGSSIQGSNGSVIAIDSVLMPEANSKMGMPASPAAPKAPMSAAKPAAPTTPAAPAAPKAE
jgi:uncharacterized surface protein with fasciclin (FAS1) repeats